ncbi:ABC transporter substrate-binding protein [Yinghuangia aomiensis]
MPATTALTSRNCGSNGGAMVLFNTTTGPFADPRARRAVALALSGSEINDKFYKGAGTPAKGIFSSSSPLANNQIAAPENDAAQAAQLFDEVTGNGAKPLAFTYVTPAAPTTVAVAKYMQAKLAAYRGVSMSIREVDVPTYIGTVRKGSGAWNAAVGQQWIDDPEPGVYDVLNAASFANLSGYNSPTVNAALDEARRTTDTTARREAYTPRPAPGEPGHAVLGVPGGGRRGLVDVQGRRPSALQRRVDPLGPHRAQHVAVPERTLSADAAVPCTGGTGRQRPRPGQSWMT